MAPPNLITIKANGSIEPATANITTLDYVTYTLTSNIFNCSIAVERSNIIIDGNGYMIYSDMRNANFGFYIGSADNITIKNTTINGFGFGIASADDTIRRFHTLINNTIVNNTIGVYFNLVSDVNITRNTFIGGGLVLTSLPPIKNTVEENLINGKPLIYLENTSNYTISDAGQVVLLNCSNIRVENLNLSNAGVGLELFYTNSCRIVNNVIAHNLYGIYIAGAAESLIYHNDFVNNTFHVFVEKRTSQYPNVWDNGFPDGGNYWSDYLIKYPNAIEIDSSGIWNISYVIDSNNIDHYPLKDPCIIPEFPSFFILSLFMLATLLVTILFRRKHSLPPKKKSRL